MEDRSWIRLALVGIVLLAIAIGYFIYTRASSQEQPSSQPPVEQSASPVPTFTPESNVSPSPSVTPSPSTEVNQNQTQTQTKGGQITSVSTLPNTGFPLELAGIFSASAITTGWFLRKFPK